MMPPNVEAIRWLALGMGIAHLGFGNRILDEVGFRAFEGPSDEGFEALQAKIGRAPWWMDALASDLGIKSKEPKWSDTIIGFLKAEAGAAWLNEIVPQDQKVMMKLSRTIAEKSGELAAWTKRMRRP